MTKKTTTSRKSLKKEVGTSAKPRASSKPAPLKKNSQHKAASAKPRTSSKRAPLKKNGLRKIASAKERKKAKLARQRRQWLEQLYFSGDFNGCW